MDLGLNKRRALVLGASRGLGKAIAHGLALEGASVIAAARNVDAIESWIAGLAQDVRDRISAAPLDLTRRDSVEAIADTALASGGIDILINNSGGPPPLTAVEAGRDVWISHFEAMAANLFHLTALLLPGMVAREWGRVITILSSGVEQPIPRLAVSNAIRSAVLGWSKTLASEVAAKGVTVNTVLPGRIETERLLEIDQANATRDGVPVAQIRLASVGAIPAGRYGSPREFADVVVFLASERASYVTGAKIRVDGGLIRSV